MLRIPFFSLTELTEFKSQAQGRRAVAQGVQPSCAAAGQHTEQFRPGRATRNNDSPSFQEFQVVGCGKLMVPDCQSLCWSNSSAACWEQRGWKHPLRAHPGFAAQDPETGDHRTSQQFRELIPGVNKRPRLETRVNIRDMEPPFLTRHTWTLYLLCWKGSL